MVTVATDLIAARRKNPSDKKDLLNAMLKGKDPKTGEGLNDDVIIKNMITFLIAGEFQDDSRLVTVLLLLMKYRPRDNFGNAFFPILQILGQPQSVP